MKKVAYGIAHYTIESNGCLNGIYTNEHALGEIFNEAARRRGVSTNGELSGIYDSSYFDVNNSHTICELDIKRRGNTNVYELVWLIDDSGVFEGIGYQMNDHIFCVQYWSI